MHSPLATVSAQSHRAKATAPVLELDGMEGERRGSRAGVTPWPFTSEHEALTLPCAAGAGGLGFGNQGAMANGPVPAA